MDEVWDRWEEGFEGLSDPLGLVEKEGRGEEDLVC